MSNSKRQREEPCYICGHYHNYESGERCSTCGHVLQHTGVAPEEANAMPTQILPGFLYVGSYDHASRLELLKAMNITHVLSLVPSCQELYRNTLTYHTAMTSPADFQECFEYIDKIRSEQKRIVVHCMTGVAKSPAVVVAYLMKLRGWTLKESYVWVKDRHPPTQLSQVDAERLQRLELETFGSSSTGYQQSQAGSVKSGGSASSNGPFSLSWGQASQPFTAYLPGSSPTLSFIAPRQRDFVFGASSDSPVPQPDTAAMDV